MQGQTLRSELECNPRF